MMYRQTNKLVFLAKIPNERVSVFGDSKGALVQVTDERLESMSAVEIVGAFDMDGAIRVKGVRTADIPVGPVVLNIPIRKYVVGKSVLHVGFARHYEKNIWVIRDD